MIVLKEKGIVVVSSRPSAVPERGPPSLASRTLFPSTCTEYRDRATGRRRAFDNHDDRRLLTHDRNCLLILVLLRSKETAHYGCNTDSCELYEKSVSLLRLPPCESFSISEISKLHATETPFAESQEADRNSSWPLIGPMINETQQANGLAPLSLLPPVNLVHKQSVDGPPLPEVEADYRIIPVSKLRGRA
jgi:hypothetical protein